MLNYLQSRSNSWFYKEMPWWAKCFGLFIHGDMVFLLPLLILIGILSFVSFRYALIAISLYIIFRQLGEMIFWLLQQFGDRKYRPYDFGLKLLDNNAIYIIYQTMALCGCIIGVSLLFFSIDIVY